MRKKNVNLGNLEVRTKFFTQQIADHIEELISKGQLREGDKLPPETEMASQFGVSRGTVGEAFSLLEQRGLIRRGRGQGTFVTTMPNSFVAETIGAFITSNGCNAEDLLKFRELMEPIVAEQAAQNATPEQINRLGVLVKKMEQEYLQDLTGKKFTALDTEFHIAIAEITGNPLLIMNMIGIRKGLKSRLEQTFGRVKVEDAATGHRKIFEAIAAKNPQAAREAMTEHMQLARRITMELQSKD